MLNSQLKHVHNPSELITKDKVGSVPSILPDAVIGLAHDHTIVFFSRSATTVFGFGPDEVVGRSFDLLLPEFERLRSHALVEDLANSAGRSLAMHQRRQVSVQRSDGSLFPAEVRFAKGWWQGRPVIFAIVRTFPISGRASRILRDRQRPWPRDSGPAEVSA